MDALGLLNAGTMSPKMRPLRPGIRMAGFAYTVKLIPTQKAVKVCSTYEEYQKERRAKTARTRSFLGYRVPFAKPKSTWQVSIFQTGDSP